MKRTTLLLGGVAALALCGQAQAGEMKGWYISLEGGASWVNDLKYEVTGPTSSTFVTAGTDTGWAVLASVGYGFSDRWRVELEGGYRHNDAPDLTSVYGTPRSSITTTTEKTGDELREYTLMANVMYDMPLSEKVSLTLGAGVGVDGAEYESDFFGKDESWNFAYQGIAGLNYAIGSRSQLFVRYRYLDVPDPEFNFPVNGGYTCCYNFNDLEKHAATVGFRFFFADAPAAAPPPPPLPPPPPPAVKQFIVFFGFNKCNITAEADRVLSEAAATVSSTGSAAVRIVGHTDSSGSAVYNQRLSECRANATTNNMIAKGVPEAAIAKSGRGESELMVQTGDGVKEPQNRRATVDIE